MKVMIEIDLPEGQAVPQAHDIIRLTDPNWHADWWHIEDVQEYYAGDGKYITFTDKQAREVLELMDRYSSPEVGISWDSINVWQEQIYNEYYDEEEV